MIPTAPTFTTFVVKNGDHGIDSLITSTTPLTREQAQNLMNIVIERWDTLSDCDANGAGVTDAEREMYRTCSGAVEMLCAVFHSFGFQAIQNIAPIDIP